jgi:glycosyltransferase involved in cell wall biosynthesis
MKVLVVNASEVEGGAAKAAVRLLRAVRREGIDAELLVQNKASDDPAVLGPRTRVGKAMGLVRPALESMVVGLCSRGGEGMFSPALLPDRLPRKASELGADVVHLHWITHGMLRVESLRRFAPPVVWTLHDSWAFTGGCHVPNECLRYRDACGRCPALGSSRERDLSRWVWGRKRRAWKDLRPTVVAPSRWLAGCARASSLFRDARVEVIPNGLDLGRFKPVHKGFAREVLGLPPDRKLVLFGGKNCSDDRNKGLHLLATALRILKDGGKGRDAELVVFGSTTSTILSRAGVAARYQGFLHDDASLALLYAAADVFVAPSIQENLPYTVMEAMACGTPCVAFEQGGLPELIEHTRTGFLARAFEPEDLAHGIAWVLEDGERWRTLSARAREKTEREFEAASVARRYVELYRELAGAAGRA